MRRTGRSVGRITLGFVGLFFGGLLGLFVPGRLAHAIDLMSVSLALFTLLLLAGSVEAVLTGMRGGPIPDGDPDRERPAPRRWFRYELGPVTRVAVILSPVALLFAVPSLCACHDTRERAYLTAAKSDLKNLQVAQEIFYSDSGTYAADLPTLQLTELEGVHAAITGHGADGYAATATHDMLPDVICAVYVGDSYLVHPATEPGVVTCTS